MAAGTGVEKEKRDFIRMNINSPVTIRHAGRQYQASCKDLSGAGLSIESAQAFDLGTQLQISIAQNNDKYQPFIAEAVVNRVQAGSPGKLLIGLAIKDIFD